MGVEGVEVNLWTGCPPVDVIATDETDENGYYEFCELEPGDYTVQFVAPAGYVFTEQYSDGCDTAHDSNAGEDGITDCVVIEDADDYTIDAGLYMPPQEGCTRTKGYWGSHDGFGPQDDMVTALLPQWLGDAGGGSSLAVTTAAIASDVLGQHTYGHPHNGITKLYAQLLAAKLNIENGADDTDIADVIDDADAFLADHSWQDWDDLDDVTQDMVLDWKTMADNYNKGVIGPGHCDEMDEDEEEDEEDGNGGRKEYLSK
jgi:hypothetical protein